MDFMFLSAAEVSKQKASPAPAKAGEFVSLGSCSGQTQKVKASPTLLSVTQRPENHEKMPR